MNLIRFGDLLVAAWKKISLSLFLAFPLLVADRIVWFHLGILVFILISILCGIPDHLSSDCFWSHPRCGDVGVGDGEAVCFQLISFVVGRSS